MVSVERGLLAAVVQQAKAGDPTAIAYWLNVCLLPQGCCAKVTHLSPPPSHQLNVQVLCRQLPDRLVIMGILRDRLQALRLAQVTGAQVTAHLASKTLLPLWQETLRLESASGTSTSPQSPSAPSSPSFTFTIARPPRSSRPTQPAVSRLPQGARSPESVAMPRWIEQLQPHRNLWLGGSAAMAFLLGCGFEAISYHTAMSSQSTDGFLQRISLPGLLSRSPHTPTSGTVQGAMEPVPVVVHPTDHAHPTVTLNFGGISLDALESSDRPLAALPAADVSLSYLSLDDADILPESQVTDEMRSLSQDVLEDSGIDIVSLSAPAPETRSQRSQIQRILSSIESAGLQAIGLGGNEIQARRPEILEVNGKRIAYFSYTSSAAAQTVEPPEQLEAQITADVQAIRPNVDWVIVNFHWRDSLAEYPSAQQIHLAHHAVDQGSDLVVGYHPHVLQGAEIYRDRAIAYSIGNFITDETSETSYSTALLKVSLRQEQMRLEFLPVQVQEGEATLADEETTDQVITYLDQASGLFDKPLRSPTILDRKLLSNPDQEHPSPLPDPSSSLDQQRPSSEDFLQEFSEQDTPFSSEDPFAESAPTDSFLEEKP